jgi:hypothetical protein
MDEYMFEEAMADLDLAIATDPTGWQQHYQVIDVQSHHIISHRPGSCKMQCNTHLSVQFDQSSIF